MTQHPGLAFLDAIQFQGFAPGAMRLGSGEIVPTLNFQVWTGGGADNKWSTGANWKSGAPPPNDGGGLGCADIGQSCAALGCCAGLQCLLDTCGVVR